MISVGGSSVDYVRSYGQHDFTLTNGEVVSVLSQPTWEEFIETLATAQSLGHIVISPELITSPMPLDQIPTYAPKIQSRVEHVLELSRLVAQTTIILGSAMFNTDTRRPANSMVFIRNGRVIAQKNKSFSLYPLEKEVFTLKPAVLPTTVDPRLAALVCSDVLGETAAYRSILTKGSDNPNAEPSVNDRTETVLLSSCWAIPIITDPKIDEVISREERFRTQLERRISELFNTNPGLLEVVVADRLAPISGVDAPYNARFRRWDGAV